MKMRYKEQYSTCMFLSRIDFFITSFDLMSEKERNLNDKIIDIIVRKNKLYDFKNNGFFGPRYGVGKLGIFAKIAYIFNFSTFNPILNIPGFYTAYNTNPRKIYQKWCEAFDNQLSDEEKQIIINAAYRQGDEFKEYGEEAWNNMQLQKQWTWWKEILHILHIKY